MADSIATKVVAIIAEQAMLDPADIPRDATLESLGVDSLGLVEAIFAIEEVFDIQVPYNANENTSENTSESGDTVFDISSVASITRAVEQLIKEAG